EARADMKLSDPEQYAELGEAIEAWGFRLMQDEGEFMDRETVANRWYAEEYLPAVRLLRDADLIGDRTDTGAYWAIAGKCYKLMRTRRWDDGVTDARTRNGPARVRRSCPGRATAVERLTAAGGDLR